MKNFDSFNKNSLSKEEMSNIKGGDYWECYAVSPDGLTMRKYISIGMTDGPAWMDFYVTLGWKVSGKIIKKSEKEASVPIFSV